VAVAQAVAGAAALFGRDSGDLGYVFGQVGETGSAAIPAGLVVPPVLGVPGGLPVRDEGWLVAGLGVGGASPVACASIARAALAAS
jgi:uncharacterized protein GlcG (DUF336 family)